MYCRMCGNKLGDTDHYCQFCGASTGFRELPAEPAEKSEMKEEVVFNPPYENKPRFAEEPEPPEETAAPEKEKDLKEFISDQEIEAAQKAQEDSGAKQEPVKNSEFTWNVYEFPTAKRKTEDIEFNWRSEEPGGQPESEPEKKEAEAAAFEKELFQEIREDSNRIREQNIDRFFTFSRKNEEFQELLDREYDKIKSRSEPLPEQPAEPVKEQPAEPIKEKPAEPGSIPVPPEEIHTEAEAEPEVEIPQETEAEPVEIIEPAEEEAPAEIIEPAEEEAQAETIEPAEEISGADTPETEIIPAEPVESPAGSVESPAEEPGEAPAKLEEAPKAGHLSEMSQAREQYFGDVLIKDNESIRKSLEECPPEEKEAEQYTVPPETPEIPANPEAAELEREEEAAPRRRSAGQIVLVIIAVILIIEIAILGIRYFAPDSAAAKAIGSAQTEIFSTISGWFSGDGSQDKTTPPDGNDQSAASSGAIEDDQSAGPNQTDSGTAEQPAPDPNPASDKDALVASQMGNNSNIQQVQANPALAYVPGKNYGLSDVNNSKPITNNIWLAPEGGEPVYYDKSVVGTVVAFDSQWIDYVNGSSKSVLDLLKKDSKAYQQTLTYSKVGKVKETFKLLEIGEIRQGAKGFYVWAHEEISITEKGTTADKAYNWIYYLEPSEGKMQIVNYFKF